MRRTVSAGGGSTPGGVSGGGGGAGCHAIGWAGAWRCLLLVTQMAISDAGCDALIFGTAAAASELSEVKPDAADTLELSAARPRAEVLRKSRRELRTRTPPGLLSNQIPRPCILPMARFPQSEP